jgi:hypothetical protein
MGKTNRQNRRYAFRHLGNLLKVWFYFQLKIAMNWVTALLLSFSTIALGVGSAVALPFPALVLIPLLFLCAAMVAAHANYNRIKHSAYVFDDGVFRESSLGQLMSFYSHVSSGDGTSNLQVASFRSGETELHYLLDNDINEFLYDDNKRRHAGNNAIEAICKSSQFHIPDVMRDFIPSMLGDLVSEYRRKGTWLFNGACVRMMEDIRPGITAVQIQKARYFDYCFTNKNAFRRFHFPNALAPSFDSKSLFINEDGSLRHISAGLAANILGISTLVLLRDGTIIVPIQGSANNDSPGKYAPSGSGSVSYQDIERLLASKDKVFLADVLCEAAEREFLEEAGWKAHNSSGFESKIRTRVIGYAKLLDFGGKPDFFALSYIDEDWMRVLNLNFRKNREVKKGLVIAYLCIQSADECITLESVITALELLLGDHFNAVVNEKIPAVKTAGSSIQLGIIHAILKNFEKKSIDPIADIIVDPGKRVMSPAPVTPFSEAFGETENRFRAFLASPVGDSN